MQGLNCLRALKLCSVELKKFRQTLPADVRPNGVLVEYDTLPRNKRKTKPHYSFPQLLRLVRSIELHLPSWWRRRWGSLAGLEKYFEWSLSVRRWIFGIDPAFVTSHYFILERSLFMPERRQSGDQLMGCLSARFSCQNLYGRSLNMPCRFCSTESISELIKQNCLNLEVSIEIFPFSPLLGVSIPWRCAQWILSLLA